ncbi:MAG: PHP domain-containing protein [Clostridia bacterium]|nr:PHP domain-containing protein [Clostridia bacterium]
MIQDLHSHTYYSFCGKDSPQAVVEAAIKGGIELFGICDHNYGIGMARFDAYLQPRSVIAPTAISWLMQKYYDHISLIKEKYKDDIKVLCGVEVATQTRDYKAELPENEDISMFDYCLIENLDDSSSIAKGDLFSFAKRCGCPAVGVAHTDMFAFIKSLGEDPLEYFSRMAEQNIFWEMNVSYDSIHGYREHPYMLEFFKNEQQQDIVRASGVRLSVGFDGHRVEDYLPERIKDHNKRITELGIKLAFEE